MPPKCFFTDGKKQHLSYTEEYLIRNGDVYGSMIAMDKNGHMKL